MFEDSLVESRIGEVSSSKRWTAFASISLQFAVAGLVIALPLWHPEALPLHIEAPKLLMPLSPAPPPSPPRVQRVVEDASSAALPTLSTPSIASKFLVTKRASGSEEPSPLSFTSEIAMPGALPGAIVTGNSGSHPSISVGPSRGPAKSLTVSSGVLQGMLIAPIRPVYPAIARAAHVEGAVVVEAIISRTGTIESLHVLSGPVMLQSAAIDAIRAARYKPYRLNGEPTEVQTTITVNFRFSF